MFKKHLILIAFSILTLSVFQNTIASPTIDDVRILTEKAKEGNPNALYKLGKIYLLGTTETGQNTTVGIAYLKQAASKHHAHAFHLLGDLYKTGVYVQQDLIASYNYYIKSAEAGEASALYELGCAHDYGFGVEQDYERAREFYLHAAENYGDPRAMFRLATMFEEGIGTEINYDYAIAYYNRLAQRFNYPGARERLDKLLVVNELEKKVKDGDEQDAYNVALRYFIGDEMVRQNQERAILLLEDAAYFDSAAANYALGKFYLEGNYFKQDKEMAFLRFDDAAGRDYLEAIYELAVMHLEGQSKNSDNEKGQTLLEQAVKREYPQAEAYLGMHYEQKKDYPKAIALYKKSFKKGSIRAKLGLGRLFFLGEGVHQNYSIAKAFFRDVVKSKSLLPNATKNRFKGEAYYYLGRMAEEGLAGPRSTATAFVNFREGLTSGCDIIMKYLATLSPEKSNYAPYLQALDCEGKKLSSEKTLKLYQLSADQGFPLAQAVLIFKQEDNDDHYYKRFLDDSKDAHLQFKVAKYFYYEEKSYDKGIELLTLAAHNGNHEAQNLLAYLYETIKKDYEKAEQLYLEALQTDDRILRGTIYFNLAMLYDGRDDGKKDPEQFLSYLQKSVDLENPQALFNIGLLYYLGRYLEKDVSRTAEYHQRAADLNYYPALDSMVILYTKGEGVEQNFDKANEYLQKANALKQLAKGSTEDSN